MFSNNQFLNSYNLHLLSTSNSGTESCITFPRHHYSPVAKLRFITGLSESKVHVNKNDTESLEALRSTSVHSFPTLYSKQD